MSTSELLLYGANGYTGTLIARAMVARGLRPTLAGRSAEPVEALARELGLPWRSFPLEAPALEAGVSGAGVVVHCAGPFVHTARPMLDACLRAGASYLDINGEVGVLEALAARDAEARARGIAILPAIGFDVVPSDCLAAHVARRLPGATRLAIGLRADGSLSAGTLATMVEQFPQGGLVRRNGRLKPVPLAWKIREFPDREGTVHTITLPLGDVTTAFHTTGIPNIDVGVAAPRPLLYAMKLWSPLAPALAARPIRELLQAAIAARGRPPSPPVADDPGAPLPGHATVWAEASDETGHRALSRLDTPGGYPLTAALTATIAERVVRNGAPAGFQTAAGLYGPDFILEFAGVSRTDLI
jgi:short subunit dehydrogenase-like uncharacterized protein